MISRDRKQELISEFQIDLQSYIQRQGLVQEFIDSTCRGSEEVEFMQEVDWWVAVDMEGEL